MMSSKLRKLQSAFIQARYNIFSDKDTITDNKKIFFVKIFFFRRGNILSNPKIFDVCVWMNVYVRDIVYTWSHSKNVFGSDDLDCV